MKYIVSILLIIVMGNSHKEIDMIQDGSSRQQRPPAWLGNRAPAWSSEDSRDRRNAEPTPFLRLNPTQATNIPGTTVPMSANPLRVQQPTPFLRLNPTQGTNIPGTNVPMRTTLPATTPVPNWMQQAGDRLNTLGPPTGFGGNAPIPNFNTLESIAQGQAAQEGQPGRLGQNVYNNPIQGVNSFIGGGGWAMRGPDGKAVWNMPAGVNTFIGAGGEAVRGPDGGAISISPTTDGGGGGGFGTNYGGNWSDGGGGYSAPAWLNPYMNLYSWNYRS